MKRMSLIFCLLLVFGEAYGLKNDFNIYAKNSRGKYVRVDNTSWKKKTYTYVGGSGTYHTIKDSRGNIFYIHNSAVTAADRATVNSVAAVPAAPAASQIAATSVALSRPPVAFANRPASLSTPVPAATTGTTRPPVVSAAASASLPTPIAAAATGTTQPTNLAIFNSANASTLAPASYSAGPSEVTSGAAGALSTAPLAKRDYADEMRKNCGNGTRNQPRKASKVSHYYVPKLGNKGPSAQKCHNMEGVCKYTIDGVEYIYNYTGGGRKSQSGFVTHATRNDVPVATASCKFGIGYGNKTNCTHPCRSLAASRSHHTPGQVLFFPELVGRKCGSQGSEMIHDGYMVVNDTGAAKHFNHAGRFDFFWGDCEKTLGGVCHEGAIKFSLALSRSSYCEAWSPKNPSHNSTLKAEFESKVRQEAVLRGDGASAVGFNLNNFR